MGNYVFLNICLYTEGTTDIRFLENIVQQTYERAAIQAYGEIDIELHVITIDKTGLNFTQQVLKAAQKAKQEYGATIICVHSDADSSSIDNTLNTKFVPAQRCLLEQENDSCSRILVTLIAGGQSRARNTGEQGSSQTDCAGTGIFQERAAGQGL